MLTYHESDIESASFELACKLNNFGYEYDTYDYMDVVDDTEKAISEFKQNLIDDNTSGIKLYLVVVITEDRWYAKEAKELLQKIFDFETKYHGKEPRVASTRISTDEFYPLSICDNGI